eukprot:m.72328 g.72328  ORF g.72328 m.72328 type:complete len:207 (+) comp16099_c0_seq40:112-732(+)
MRLHTTSKVSVCCLISIAGFLVDPVFGVPMRESTRLIEPRNNTAIAPNNNEGTLTNKQFLRKHRSANSTNLQLTARRRLRRQQDADPTLDSTLAQTTTLINTSTDAVLDAGSPEVIANVEIDDNTNHGQYKQCHAGSLALSSLFALWLFTGIYVVCDHYFIPSLEEFGDVLLRYCIFGSCCFWYELKTLSAKSSMLYLIRSPHVPE